MNFFPMLYVTCEVLPRAPRYNVGNSWPCATTGHSHFRTARMQIADALKILGKTFPAEFELEC